MKTLVTSAVLAASLVSNAYAANTYLEWSGDGPVTPSNSCAFSNATNGTMEHRYDGPIGSAGDHVFSTIIPASITVTSSGPANIRLAPATHISAEQGWSVNAELKSIEYTGTFANSNRFDVDGIGTVTNVTIEGVATLYGGQYGIPLDTTYKITHVISCVQ